MLIVRYEKDGLTQYGHVDNERVGPIVGNLFDEFARGPAKWPLADVTLLAPCLPSKIIAVGPNFTDRLRELGETAPPLPRLYFKAPSALIGPGAAIRLPAVSHHVEHGVELAVVIGKRARHVTPDAALHHVLGYTCANDVLAVDVAQSDGAWTRASSFDTFCPLGPHIATHPDPAALMLSCAVNGVTRQLSSTHDMRFSVSQVIAFASAAMTLWPGDVILMGSPAGSGPLAPGDTVEVEIEGIGKLSNPVEAETPPAH